MPEALETWPVEMFGRMLPRHLQIIFDINARFLASVTQTSRPRRRADAAPLADRRIGRAPRAHGLPGGARQPLGQRRVGPALGADEAIDLRRLRQLFPERFNNKTNGVTPRRWLAQANPPLAALIDARIGRGWRRDLIAARGAAADGAAAAFRASLPPCQAREQAAARATGSTQHLRIVHRHRRAVRRAGQAHSRIQAAAAQRAARDHALPPHPATSRSATGTCRAW